MGLRGAIRELERLIEEKDEALASVEKRVQRRCSSRATSSSVDWNQDERQEQLQLVDSLVSMVEASQSRLEVAQEEHSKTKALLDQQRAKIDAVDEVRAVEKASWFAEASEMYLRLSVGCTQLAELHGPSMER